MLTCAVACVRRPVTERCNRGFESLLVRNIFIFSALLREDTGLKKKYHGLVRHLRSFSGCEKRIKKTFMIRGNPGSDRGKLRFMLDPTPLDLGLYTQ
jgi:hypothetical protein